MTEQPKSWRDQIDIHPAADLSPLMKPDKKQAVGEDIRKNGLHVPVAIFKEQKHFKPRLLAGRNRLDAMEAVGFSIHVDHNGSEHHPQVKLWARWPNHDMWVPIEFTELRGDEGINPFDYVKSENIHRNHFTAAEQRVLIAALLKAQPQKSNRQIAKEVGRSHPHVAAVRAELEKSGDVETVTTSIDTKGRRQPARKPAKDKCRAAADFLGRSVPVQRILNALDKLDDQQLAEMQNIMMITLEDLRDRVAVLLRDASKDKRMDAIDMMMKALDLDIHDWVSTMAIGLPKPVSP